MTIFLQILYTVIILGILIFIHEFGHFIVARSCGIKVNEFALGMGPKILKIQGKKTLYTLRLFPIGGFCAMEGEDGDSEDGDAFFRKPVWKRMLVVVAGAFMNLILGFLITVFLVIFSEALPSKTIGGFDDDALSSDKLQIGDEIIAIDGKRINVYSDITTVLSSLYNATETDVTVIRDGVETVVEDVSFPSVEAAEGLSCMVLDFLVYREDKSIGNIVKESFCRTYSYITTVYGTLADLITGKISVKYMSGPVGISETISTAASYGFETVLYLVALLSINLAVMNLLPLPALDGGRFFFMLIELIFRKKVPDKVEAGIHFAGLIVLFGFMIFVTVKDIFFPVI